MHTVAYISLTVLALVQVNSFKYDNTIFTLGSHNSRFAGPRINGALELYDSMKSDTNNCIMFVGKNDEQKSFKNIVDNKQHLKYTYEIIPQESENTANHIMCMLNHFINNFKDTCKSKGYGDLKVFELPKITIVTHKFHINRFKRTYNMLKSTLRSKYDIFIKNSPMDMKLINTPEGEEKWLTDLEELHNTNIIDDIKKALDSECGKNFLKYFE